MTKACNTCGIEKPLDAYVHEVRSGETYVRPKCKKCFTKAYYTPKERPTTKACADCGVVAPVESYPLRPGKKNRARGTRFNVCRPCHKRRRRAEYRKHGKAGQLRRNFNLTPERYEQMLAEQGGRCAICRADSPRGGHGWCVDHDHDCCPKRGQSCGECVRGLLCLPCNTALGAFNDDLDTVMSAAAYLLAHQDVLAGISRMDPSAT